MRQLTRFLQPVGTKKLSVKLDKDGKEAELLVAFAGKGREEYHLFTQALHQARHTRSYTLVRGVLFGRAKARVGGMIKIAKKAQHTNAFLEEKILLVGKQAQAEAEPQLEIEANEVKASHAATVGTIDEEQLFYLMSRGLSRDQAKRVIVLGFFQPVLDRIKKPAVKTRLKLALQKQLPD